MKFNLATDFKSSVPRPFKRGRNYYIRQRIAGRDVWRSLKTSNKREAEALAYRIWYAQQNDIIKNIIGTPNLPLSIVWEEYTKTERYKLLKDSTKADRFKVINSFINWCNNRNIKFIQEITKETAEEYLNSKKRANKTFNCLCSHLIQIFSPICEQINITNPFTQIKLRSISRGEGASKDYRAFTPEEVKLILEVIQNSKMQYKDEWIAAVKLSLYTGLRYKDIAFLQWTHIVDNQYIEIIPAKTENKTGKAVIINLTRELQELLMERKKNMQNFYVLPNLAKNYNSEKRTATKPFRKILKKLNLSGKIGFHSLRSTFITWAREAGIDYESLLGVVGHTNIAQTRHYDKSAIKVSLDFITKRISNL